VGALHERGHQVLAVGRDEARLTELCTRLRGVETVVVDLAHPARLAGGIGGRIERLHGLVHCAAVADIAAVSDASVELWYETLTVNVIAVAELTRLLLPAVRAARGHVVFVGASPGVHGAAGWSAHAASKAALRDLADSLRVEESGHGVHVTSVYPGATATELLQKLRQQSGRPYDPSTCASPDSVARVIIDCLEAPADLQVTDLYLEAAPGTAS
jgi:short-subunit dehydrogenase